MKNKTINKCLYSIGNFFLHCCNDEYLFERQKDSDFLITSNITEPYTGANTVSDTKSKADCNVETDHDTSDVNITHDSDIKSHSNSNSENTYHDYSIDAFPEDKNTPDFPANAAEQSHKTTPLHNEDTAQAVAAFEKMLEQQKNLVDEYDRRASLSKGNQRCLCETVVQSVIDKLLLSGCQPISNDLTYDSCRHRTVPINIMLEDGISIRSFIRTGVAWHGRTIIKAIVEVEQAPDEPTEQTETTAPVAPVEPTKSAELPDPAETTDVAEPTAPVAPTPPAPTLPSPTPPMSSLDAIAPMPPTTE